MKKSQGLLKTPFKYSKIGAIKNENMLKRKIEKQFKEWKSSKSRNPLIVKGCRQCGKTYSVLNFAKANYKSVVYVNFFENPLYASAFDQVLSVD